METILIHACCAGCATIAIERLKSEYEITLFFSNSNIYPPIEFIKRFNEVRKVAEMHDIKVIEDGYNEDDWLKYIEGLENEPERGLRCNKCIEYRLDQTAVYALKYKFDNFTTTLTTSPHKNAEYINATGYEIMEFYGVTFIPLNLKKKDGFKRSVELSKEHDLYRQDYCGCRFSKN